MPITRTTQRSEPLRSGGPWSRPVRRPPSAWSVRAALAVAALLPALLACGGEGETPSDAPAQVPARARPRALWVLAEGHQQVLEHPERVPDLLEVAQLLKASDLFVQVYRGGRAWFDSRQADATPFVDARAAAGYDPLADLLRRAHAAGLRVHAWVNVLSLAHNRDAPLLRALGREVVLVDRHGRSLLDYPDLKVPAPHGLYYRMGTPGVYLDPAASGLAARLAETFEELLVRYPALDGLHLDYIRYPDVLPFTPGSRFGVGLDFGYGEATRARFRRETGVEAPTGDATRNANRWDAWRRDKLTELVATIAGRARSARPEIALSAAVWTYADRGYLALGQDWRRWLEDGLLDFAVPMAYTRDDRLFRYQAEAFANMPLAERVWIGLGTWLFAEQPERAIEQIQLARKAGIAGEALFSYDSIAAAPPLREALIRETQREP